MNRIAITLEQFFKKNQEDGYYAVWITDTVEHPDNNGLLFGFSGAVVSYDTNDGFSEYPDWFDKEDEREISIILLEEIPSVEELRSY